MIRNDWAPSINNERATAGSATGLLAPAPVMRARSRDFTLRRVREGAVVELYCDYPTARTGRFEGDRVTICLCGDGSFAKVLVYRLSLAGAP